MSRDDAMFTTAMSSSSPTRLVSPSTRRRRAEADEGKHKIDPKAEAVLLLIAQEKEKVTSIKDIMFDEKSTKEQRADLLDRRKDKYLFLDELERKMKKILNVIPQPPEATS